MTPPTPDAATQDVCSALSARLPDTVAGLDRRTTTPPTSNTAAWGDPPIVLRCGVPRPAALTATSQLYTVDGVDWFPEALTEGTLLTTYGRTAYVEVTVPRTYPAGAAVSDLTAAITAADPPAG